VAPDRLAQRLAPACFESGVVLRGQFGAVLNQRLFKAPLIDPIAPDGDDPEAVMK
jgi:hypothetical protein